ncbi:unnamed protein product [Umbelopsis vinacea]
MYNDSNDNQYKDGDPGPSKRRKDKGKGKANAKNLEDTDLNSLLLYLLQCDNIFVNAPLRIYETSTPNISSTLAPKTPSLPPSSFDIYQQIPIQAASYVLAPSTPSPPCSPIICEQIPPQPASYVLAPNTPTSSCSPIICEQVPTHGDLTSNISTVPAIPIHSLFTGIHQPFYLSPSEKKTIYDTLQDIIDDRAMNLEYFDIDDSNRTLPPHIFDNDDLPLSSQLRIALEKARKKWAEQAKRRKEKSNAKKVEEISLQREKRGEAGESEPKCASCGQEGHLRSSSKSCPNYKLKTSVRCAAAGLTRNSTIKTSLQRGCLNEIFRREIQQAVLRSRNLAHVSSLFANFAIVNRLQSGQSVPPLNHTFFYNMFCQLIGQGSHADQWVKDSYQDFRQRMPATLPSTFYADTAMVTRIAQDYQTNFRSHITSNFERNCTNYFFLRLNNDADPWYVANATVKERKSIAAYIYKRAASLQSTWPDIENEEIS